MSARTTAEPQTVGKIIKAWRRRRKLTQKELASRTGLTPGDLSAFERGESVPKAGDRKRICAALEVELRDFDAEVAWRESQKEAEPVGDASEPKEMTIEELSTSWDLISSYLRPWFLKLAEWTLREEAKSKRSKRSKP